MNIFFLSIDPILAAQMLCDKHIVKMILETCQLMWAAYHMQPGARPKVPSKIKEYKLTHANHPASKWTRHARANFLWLARHGIAACREYAARYGRQHACQAAIEWLADCGVTTFANQTYAETTVLASFDYPAECSPPPICVANRELLVHFERENVVGYSLVQSYRNYYRKEKASFARWARSPTPAWFTARIIIE